MENSTKIITIAKVEMTAYESGNQYKVTATDGLKFKFYDKKKDGNSTVAFTQFQDMGLKIGSTCEVWFKEQDKEYQGKPYTDRIIASFREAKSAPAQTPTSPQKTAVKSNLSEPAYVPETKDEKFWDKKAYKQCLWNYWLEYITKQTEHRNLTEAEMNGVWSVFNQIEKDADKRFAQGWDKAVKTFGTDQMPCNEEVPLPEYPYVEPTDSDLGIPF